MKIRGWTGNRADSPVDYDVEELADEYLESGFPEEYEGWPLDRTLRVFLAAQTSPAGHAGKNLAWDPYDAETAKAYDELFDLIITKRSKLEPGRLA